MFATRLIKPELLDHARPEVAQPNLTDLMRINRTFGGLSVIRKTMEQAVGDGQERFTLVDIGAASGDTGREIKARYPRATVVSLDYNETNIGWAERPKIIADAFKLPFAAGSIDYVLCSLFLHHFQDEQVIELLRNFYEVCRRALLVCDLERHIMPYLFLPATKFLFRWQEITLHDGPISVRASFRANELRELSERAGIRNPRIAVHRPAFRLSLIARKL